jgi:hypothetical protein
MPITIIKCKIYFFPLRHSTVDPALLGFPVLFEQKMFV